MKEMASPAESMAAGLRVSFLSHRPRSPAPPAEALRPFKPKVASTSSQFRAVPGIAGVEPTLRFRAGDAFRGLPSVPMRSGRSVSHPCLISARQIGGYPCFPVCLATSTIVTSSASAIASTVDQPGFARPRSIFDRWPTVIAAPWARASCVMPRSVRSSRTAFAIGVLGSLDGMNIKFSKTGGIGQR